MTQTKNQSFLFDPGFAQHTTILSMNIEYIYAGINQFKNFGQRKMKFKMLYPQILKIVDNNVGFWLGCLLWAVYIKPNASAIIEGNPCLGGDYNEAESVEEADYSINYFTQLKKDAKYYLGIDYEINPAYIKILELYKEFIKINRGFIDTKITDDIKLPETLKIPSEQELEEIYNAIQDAVKSGNLLGMLSVFNYIYEG